MSTNYNDLWNDFLYGERLNEGKKGKKKSKKPHPPNMGRMDKYKDKKKGGGRKFAKDFQDLLAVETLDDFIKQYQKMFGDGEDNTNKKALKTMVAKLKRGEEIEEDDMGSLSYFIKKAWKQVQLSENKKQKRRQIFAKLADTFDRLRAAEQSPEATEPEDGGQAPGEEERGAEDTTTGAEEPSQDTQDAPQQKTGAEIDAEIDAIINAPKPEREPTRDEKLTMMKQNNPRVWRSWLDELIKALQSGNTEESIKWYRTLGGDGVALGKLIRKVRRKKVQESKLTDAQKAIIHERIIQALTEINWKTATPEEKAAFKARAKARRKKRDAARADRAVTNVQTSPGDEISSDLEGVNIPTRDIADKINQLGDLLAQPLEAGKKEDRVNLVRQQLADLKDLGIPQKEYDRLARAAISKLKTPETTQDPEAAALDTMKSDAEEMMTTLELIVPNADAAENAKVNDALKAGYEETAPGAAGEAGTEETTDSDVLDLGADGEQSQLAKIQKYINNLKQEKLQLIRSNNFKIKAYKSQIRDFERDSAQDPAGRPTALIKSHEKRIAELELENEKNKQAFEKEHEKAKALVSQIKQQQAAKAAQEEPSAEAPTETPAFRASPPVRRRRASEIVNEEEDNPWAICTASVGRDDEEKYEDCVMSVKKQKGLDEAELEEKKKRKKRRKRKRRAYGYGGSYMFDTDGDGGDGGGGE